MMPRPKNEPLKLAQRRAAVAEQYLTGGRQWEIAEKLGIDPGTVSRDLKLIHTAWAASALNDVNTARARELDKIDQLERMYWNAWLRSCEDKESTTTEKATGGETDRLKAARKLEGQSGNPAFLAGVQWCIAKRCQIRGLDAPVGVNIGGAVKVYLASEDFDPNLA